MKDKYIELIERGYTTKQIGLETNESTSKVKRNLKKLGLQTVHYSSPKNLNKEELERLIQLNYSTYAIANELKCSRGCIRHALQKFGLKTNIKYKCYSYSSNGIDNTIRTCPKCQETKEFNNDNFYIKKNNGKPHAWCRSCNDNITYEKQLQRKRKAVEYKGGKCCVCGYSHYIGALDFHHINPNEKTFNISKLRSYSWDVIKNEVDKCVLVCKNCHAEIHHGLIDLNSLS